MFPEAVCDVVFRMRTALRAAAIAAVGLLTACGAVGARPAGSTAPPSPTASAAAQATAHPVVPLRTPPTNAPRTVVVSEQDNGHAISLRSGERLEVVLASTYWEVDGGSNPNVLRPTAQPTTSPELKGCVPGEGCGTVTALYDAVAPGRADVNAKRTSCGEAMSCTGTLGFYRVTVVVAP
jgi:hypothetical protein